MKLYHYDQNGHYTGQSTADESPLEPGVYHCPSGATFDAVPAHDAAREVAIYLPAFWPTGMPKDSGGAWRVADKQQGEN